jgi:hypothetical protein
MLLGVTPAFQVILGERMFREQKSEIHELNILLAVVLLVFRFCPILSSVHSSVVFHPFSLVIVLRFFQPILIVIEMIMFRCHFPFF